MRFGKLQPFLNKYIVRGQHADASRVDQLMPYQIVALCESPSVMYVEHLIKQQLRSADCLLPTIAYEPFGRGQFVHITVSVSWPISKRATLMRLVSRLGLEKSVRSIRWENMSAGLKA